MAEQQGSPILRVGSSSGVLRPGPTYYLNFPGPQRPLEPRRDPLERTPFGG